MDLIPLPQVHEKTNGSHTPHGHLLFPNHLDHSWLVRGLVPNTLLDFRFGCSPPVRTRDGNVTPEMLSAHGLVLNTLLV